MKIDFTEVRKNLRWLRGEDGVVPETEAVDVLALVLRPLLLVEGYDISKQHGAQELGVDLIGSPADDNSPKQNIGVEYKHHGQGKPIALDAVNQLLSAARSMHFDRLMLIGRFGFTDEAREAAERREPVRIELLDLTGIDEWINRVEAGEPDYAGRVQILIRGISHEFARLVAENPETLDELEWRDLERMMERVMSGLGFSVTLTLPSKDGGKDLILTCNIQQGEQSYIVELKHWRSGKGVGKVAVRDFLQVIIAENRSGGLFLSTSGYAEGAFEGLTEVTRQRLRFGSKIKVVLLAQTYIKALSGLWSPPEDLPDVLFEATL
jgi:restriction system protein